MIERGARHLALIGRRRRPAESTAHLRAFDADVRAFQADVSSRGDLEAVLGQIVRAMPPVRGILHAAGVVDDAALRDLTAERVASNGWDGDKPGLIKAPAARTNLARSSERARLLRSLDEEQVRLLQLFEEADEIAAKDVGSLFGIAARAAAQLCDRWSESGFLEIASEKPRRYRLAPAYAALTAY